MKIIFSSINKNGFINNREPLSTKRTFLNKERFKNNTKNQNKNIRHINLKQNSYEIMWIYEDEELNPLTSKQDSLHSNISLPLVLVFYWLKKQLFCEYGKNLCLEMRELNLLEM